MSVRDRVLEMLDWADAREQEFVEGLSPEERQAEGTFQEWSAKDVLGHLVAWKYRLAEMVQAVATGEAPPSFEDFDQENAAIYQEYHPLPLEKVIRRSRQAQQELMRAAGRLDEELLADPERLPWLQGQPLWRRMAGSGFIHPLLHLTEFLRKSGQVGKALALSEQAADYGLRMSEDPEWQGVLHYNLACAYALAGEREQALTRLAEAFRLRPALAKWSRQDPDLASIRENSSFPQSDRP